MMQVIRKHVVWGRRAEAIMRTALGISLAMFFALACLNSWAQSGGEYAPRSAVEFQMLPKWCLGYFKRDLGPKYKIDLKSCGYGMNHYCGGVVLYNRSRTELSPKLKNHQLKKALNQTNYTLNAMVKYPHCEIRRHVEKMKLVIQRDIAVSAFRVSGERRSRSK